MKILICFSNFPPFSVRLLPVIFKSCDVPYLKRQSTSYKLNLKKLIIIKINTKGQWLKLLLVDVMK